MRSSKSRSRSKANRNRSTLGNVVNRVFDSSGPEGKVRGTPQQIIDKYNQLARDAQLGNDRVAAENFQQHAEHYLRMLAEAQREQDARREQQEREQEARREQQERESRDRQAQRDRERAERNDRDTGDDSQPQERSDPSQAPQPDVIDVSDAAPDDSGLVATPEDQPKPRKPRGPRKPRRKDTDGDSAPETTAPDAAE